MIQNAMDEKVFAWHPDGAVSKQSRLASFMKLCGLDSYDAFYQYSINNIPRFTSQVLDFLNIQFDKAYSQILDLSAGLPWAHWCIGGSLNISRSCLDQHIDSPRAAAPAIIWEGEEGASRILTYAELF
jgi:acetyl-CoA synthetase